MIPGKNKKDSLEVSSDQLKQELSEMNDRLGALETIATIANKTVVEGFVRGSLTTEKGKLIMKECEVPRTKDYLVTKLQFGSSQALDYHLRPLREHDLIRQHVDDDDGNLKVEWSNLFRRLPKAVIKEILSIA